MLWVYFTAWLVVFSVLVYWIGRTNHLRDPQETFAYVVLALGWPVTTIVLSFILVVFVVTLPFQILFALGEGDR
jgi:hypothetical protein